MLSKKEMLFLVIAVQEEYLDQDEVLSYLQKKEQKEEPKEHLLRYLKQEGLLSSEKIKEIKEKCQNVGRNKQKQAIRSFRNFLRHGQTNQTNDLTTNLTNDLTSNLKTNLKTELITKDGAETSADTSADTSANKATKVSSPTVLRPGENFRHYRVQKKLGQGGMGAVYKVYDPKLERKVALKVILPGQEVNENFRKRFLQEAKATAQLKHPHIISVLEVGEEPQNYFTMEYIKGFTLKELIDKNKLTPLQVASLLLKVTKGVSQAHHQGIIHRDIKPANIMVTKNRQPKLMDFGLAKIIDTKLSKTGETLGTPAYMPPEQAEGTTVDARSDVYSIGATLYEALTGRAPFQGESYFNILHQILNAEPVRPKILNPDIPVELEAICLKCLEKDPAKRYSSAQSLAQDFDNFLQQKPIQACIPNRWILFKKFILRHKLPCTTSFVGFIFLIALMGWIMEKRHSRIALELEKQQVKRALQELSQNQNWQVRVALASLPIISDEILNKLASDQNWQVRKAVAISPIISPEILQKLAQDSDQDVRLAVFQNSQIGKDLLSHLAEDSSYLIRASVARHPQTTPDILEKLSQDSHWQVRAATAQHKNASESILHSLSQDHDNDVRVAVAKNLSCSPDLLASLIQPAETMMFAMSSSEKSAPESEDVYEEKIARVVACASNSNASDNILSKLSQHESNEVRLAVAANPNTPEKIRKALQKDSNSKVRVLSQAYDIKSTPEELTEIYQKYSKTLAIRQGIASNPNTPQKILEELFLSPEEDIRFALAKNPSTPQKILEKLVFDKNSRIAQKANARVKTS